MVEAGNTLRTLGVSVTDPGIVKYSFNGILDNTANKFAYRVAVGSERPSQKAFIEQNRVGCAETGDGLQARGPAGTGTVIQ